jgi:hypothetical protein
MVEQDEGQEFERGRRSLSHRGTRDSACGSALTTAPFWKRYLQGIDSGEIIETVHARRAPMIPVSASVRL